MRRGEFRALRAQAVEEALRAGVGGERLKRAVVQAGKRAQFAAGKRSHAIA